MYLNDLELPDYKHISMELTNELQFHVFHYFGSCKEAEK
jgi:hypothetical protein